MQWIRHAQFTSLGTLCQAAMAEWFEEKCNIIEHPGSVVAGEGP
jgi:hypothetical protein